MTVIAENRYPKFLYWDPPTQPGARELSIPLEMGQRTLAATLGIHMEYDEKRWPNGAISEFWKYFDPRYATPFQEPRS